MYVDLQMFKTCWVMFKLQPSVTLRLFTEGTKCISESPLRIEEGRENLTDNLREFTGIDSGLLSFNWSVLYVIHKLASVIQFCMIPVVVWIWQGEVSLYNWLSSVNAWCWSECFLISSNSSCVSATRQRERAQRPSPGERRTGGELRLI